MRVAQAVGAAAPKRVAQAGRAAVPKRVAQAARAAAPKRVAQAARAAPPPRATAAGSAPATAAGSAPARPRAPCVVLDAGHGGRDIGARGASGLVEKDVTLEIVRATRAELRARGVCVQLTRDGDHYVSLAERAAVANRIGAAAFVSVHANAAPGRHVRGIETHYLDTAHRRYGPRLAARERGGGAPPSDLRLVLADLSTKGDSLVARELAVGVQRGLAGAARPLNPRGRDLGVKTSMYAVLLGPRMPAVLAETSFLSNPEEARLLASPGYRARLAHGLAEAILAHLTHPPAAMREPP